ncbi:pyruvate formate-lyase-activating protein [Tissierella sp. Yu-01]|uniref:pyruvate formate-lyase-activating protein n=1 Tax=Tissierella sp. Yu-01 TaxID=3035694 RepID=UPI00240DAB3E|nr:pyruvate formate-lyase-activating protein [Tissierella sp. Yu-01]WFA07970.1 pyruvate formate-lyase-activating protein [Tissierella sp. Yu-01]
MKGRLHSIETMGLVDGPGIRTVIFLQGCPLRCAYCHNPDSQTMFSNREITPEEVLNIARRYKKYYDRSGGGITFSGGECLLQGEFLLETLKLLKAEGFNTAIDTTGYGKEEYFKEILKYVDTVILDIKHFDNIGYKDLTGVNMNGFYKFLSYLDDFTGKLWIRHVMVPGITDNEESIYKLFDRIAYLADKIDRIEILPYHTMALDKYEALGREYRLKDVPEMDANKAMEYQEILTNLLKDEKQRVINTKRII